MSRAVCVYCASATDDPAALALADAVGAEIGFRGWQLVSGGGNVSMMGRLARAARAAGAHTVGVIPKALVHRELADVDADELIRTDTMNERKLIMAERADAFIALPGGIGTLEELFEVWTSRYLGLHDKPVVLLDPSGHYRPLLDWLRGLQRGSYVSAEALSGLAVTADVGAALDLCAGAAARAVGEGAHR